MSSPLSTSLSLMRRFPPVSTEKNLAGISKLIEDDDLVDQLYQRVDKPLEVSQCQSTGSYFILCEFNKDADSYRSPWSNKYQPELPDGVLPSEQLRRLEVLANEVFREYVRLYYDSAVSSVYFWDTNPGEFACMFSVRKDMDPSQEYRKKLWESTNVILAKFSDDGRSITYSLTSSIYLSIEIQHPTLGSLNFSGGVSRQSQETTKVNADTFGDYHVYNMICHVETVETQLRNALDQVYVGKTQEILDRTRKLEISPVRGGVKLPGF